MRRGIRLKPGLGDGITFSTFHLKISGEFMPDSHRRKLEDIDPYKVTVRFSPRVKAALADLEAAVHFSKHFDGDGYAILHSWVTGKAPSIREVLVSLPLLAEDTFEHIRMTGDQRAADAWRQICSDMLEHGFTLRQQRGIAKGE